MTDVPFGTILLADFPFTDLSASKRRPAQVIFGDMFGEFHTNDGKIFALSDLLAVIRFAHVDMEGIMALRRIGQEALRFGAKAGRPVAQCQKSEVGQPVKPRRNEFAPRSKALSFHCPCSL
jgi:hypothetical protein